MNIAIVGASGAVGQEFMKVLAERRFPIRRLSLFGSKRSAGRTYIYNGEEISVQELTHDSAPQFADVDIVFASAGASTSREYADVITSGGALMIDNSSAFRMDPDVPLVVPEVNGDDAFNTPRHIIANPNCTTIQMVVALKPIDDISRIRRVRVATYQAASGAGAAAMDELVGQHADIAAGRPAKAEKFVHQLAFNVIPHVDVFTDNGYTKEEMKMFNETRKIMHSPDIRVSATCVRVPVLRAHSEATWIETEEPVGVERALEAWSCAPGVVVVDRREACGYPMPLDIAGKDEVYVGRVREDLADPCGLSFWTVSDQIKKGAALNAVQIAEYLLANGWNPRSRS